LGDKPIQRKKRSAGTPTGSRDEKAPDDIDRVLAELKDRVLRTSKLQEELNAILESHAAERIEGGGSSTAPVWRVTIETGDGNHDGYYLRRAMSAAQAAQLVLEKHEEEIPEDLPSLTVRVTREPVGL